jgi:hypothetical protein
MDLQCGQLVEKSPKVRLIGLPPHLLRRLPQSRRDSAAA